MDLWIFLSNDRRRLQLSLPRVMLFVSFVQQLLIFFTRACFKLKINNKN
jgi:hypothetical protein